MRRRRTYYGRGRYGYYGGVLSTLNGTFGFAIDACKVIFKLTPDSDQSMSDFIFEKLGALALLFVCVIVIIALVFFLLA